MRLLTGLLLSGSVALASTGGRVVSFDLPPLPNAPGVAGPFSGVVEGERWVGGGASISDAAFGELPGTRPATTVVPWHGRWVVSGGEVRPGARSSEVQSLGFATERKSFGALNWTVLAIYLGGMVAIGWGFMRRDAAGSTDRYFRGGQRVPWLVAGLSIFATMLSSLTFMGIPARAYHTDMSWYIGQLPILVIAPLVAYCYLPFFRKLDLTSAYEYLESRFGLAARLFGSMSFILFHIGRVAIVLYLPALALAAVSDIGISISIVVIGSLCILYTVMGGITAVVWTDAIQAVVLLGGALLCLVIAVGSVDGGWAGAWAVARADHKLFESLEWTSLTVSGGTNSAGILFLAFLFNSLVSYTSSQDVVQRYVTTPDLSRARRSLWTTMWMSVFGSMIFFALGTAIYVFYQVHPGALTPGLDRGDSILPFYIMTQLPAGLSGLVIAAIFAASQSTISSSLNSVASAWTQDFDRRLLRRGRTDEVYLRAAKRAVVLVGVAGMAVAMGMAQAQVESAFKTFNTMIGLTAGALGGLFALGVFTSRANSTGAIVGALTAAGLVLALHLSRAPVTGLLYAFIGCATCVTVGWLTSLVFPGKRREDLSLHGSSWKDRNDEQTP
jgi:solute:Na+ symporter, SSS family